MTVRNFVLLQHMFYCWRRYSFVACWREIDCAILVFVSYRFYCYTLSTLLVKHCRRRHKFTFQCLPFRRKNDFCFIVIDSFKVVEMNCHIKFLISWLLWRRKYCRWFRKICLIERRGIFAQFLANALCEQLILTWVYDFV